MLIFLVDVLSLIQLVNHIIGTPLWPYFEGFWLNFEPSQDIGRIFFVVRGQTTTKPSGQTARGLRPALGMEGEGRFKLGYFMKRIGHYTARMHPVTNLIKPLRS